MAESMTLHTPFPPSAGAGPAGGGAMPAAGRAEFGQAAASATSLKWAALHEAMGVVAMLAGLAPEPMRSDVRNFPAVIRDAGGWRRTLAEQGIDDLAAIIETGLAALLAVHGRGAATAPAALALWHEFQAARAGLLALAPPPPVRELRRFT